MKSMNGYKQCVYFWIVVYEGQFNLIGHLAFEVPRPTSWL
uniref:Uncharacterized protein n=1 Tax=Rhizophora mucronata TaxID=61149 RepID=A0A2P2JQH4_RHIMU